DLGLAVLDSLVDPGPADREREIGIVDDLRETVRVQNGLVTLPVRRCQSGYQRESRDRGCCDRASCDQVVPFHLGSSVLAVVDEGRELSGPSRRIVARG